jgi:hypothetical protein
MADNLDADPPHRPPIDAQIRNYARRHGSEFAPVLGMTVATVHRARTRREPADPSADEKSAPGDLLVTQKRSGLG